MNGAIFRSMLLLIGLESCCQGWPLTEQKEVRDLLLRGPQGIECFESAWMKKNKTRDHSYFYDSDHCKSNIEILDISTFHDIVTGVARCKIGNVYAEYKLSVFKSGKRNKYYGGYYCTTAQGENINQLPVGSVTDAVGAM